MTSIAQINENEQREIEGTLKKFFADYRIGNLLKVCRAEKQKGYPAFQIFRYLLCLRLCSFRFLTDCLAAPVLILLIQVLQLYLQAFRPGGQAIPG